ncbi:hypothetical protein K461DRAFT_25585 [Myriangium duriaei CBS 260.36]|uniref:C2H2-type domain-containing protein n=1 Tax=Myriangium duriaei CBS 260.36 TaxID=1168546 RepID=A0A9P4MLY8_9PEZI|nr:hypothetical protein K461DRAFT_25585 [Myriangium duriaei CBS 260.36]
MLTSSLHNRRQQLHRRQDSLEVPRQLINTNIPGSPQRHTLLDNSTTLSPTFGRLSTQDTNPGQFQHTTMQGAQQQCAAQPGFQTQPLDPRVQTQIAHLQMIQMMQEQASRQGSAPPEQAVRNIQTQLQSYYEAYPQLGHPGMSPQSRPGSSGMTMPVSSPMVMPATTPVLSSPSYPASVASGVSPNMSPIKENGPGMATLFEDSPMMPTPEMMAAQQQMMMAAAAGHGYFYPDSPMRVPMSPREAMLASLEVDASIKETGISAEEVQSFISPQDPSDGKWTCMFPGCDKKFGRKENIKSHVQTHLDDRQFQCNHCGKCFVRQHDLKRHAKIHSGDKPHKCPCGNGFARQDALTRHRQRGVCSGALPGYERRGEVKRGRPRKNRPELADRADKASRARRMDARRGSEDLEAYSSSSPSDSGSDPYTPPQMSDCFGSDNVAELDLGTAEGVEAFIRAYSENTPPTSPMTSGASNSSRPESFDAARRTFDLAAASSHASSPLSHHSPSGPAAFDFASPVTADLTKGMNENEGT